MKRPLTERKLPLRWNLARAFDDTVVAVSRELQLIEKFLSFNDFVFLTPRELKSSRTLSRREQAIDISSLLFLSPILSLSLSLTSSASFAEWKIRETFRFISVLKKIVLSLESNLLMEKILF